MKHTIIIIGIFGFKVRILSANRLAKNRCFREIVCFLRESKTLLTKRDFPKALLRNRRSWLLESLLR